MIEIALEGLLAILQLCARAVICYKTWQSVDIGRRCPKISTYFAISMEPHSYHKHFPKLVGTYIFESMMQYFVRESLALHGNAQS